MKGCESCAAAEAAGLDTCSFHRVSDFDFDECDRHPVRVVRFVPAPTDDTDW